MSEFDHVFFLLLLHYTAVLQSRVSHQQFVVQSDGGGEVSVYEYFVLRKDGKPVM